MTEVLHTQAETILSFAVLGLMAATVLLGKSPHKLLHGHVCTACDKLASDERLAKKAADELYQRKAHTNFHRDYAIKRGDPACSRCSRDVGFE